MAEKAIFERSSIHSAEHTSKLFKAKDLKANADVIQINDSNDPILIDSLTCPVPFQVHSVIGRRRPRSGREFGGQLRASHQHLPT